MLSAGSHWPLLCWSLRFVSCFSAAAKLHRLHQLRSHRAVAVRRLQQPAAPRPAVAPNTLESNAAQLQQKHVRAAELSLEFCIVWNIRNLRTQIMPLRALRFVMVRRPALPVCSRDSAAGSRHFLKPRRIAPRLRFVCGEINGTETRLNIFYHSFVLEFLIMKKLIASFVALSAFAPFAIGAFSSPSSPCSCCEICTCSACVCTESGCACGDGGACACSASCCPDGQCSTAMSCCAK